MDGDNEPLKVYTVTVGQFMTEGAAQLFVAVLKDKLDTDAAFPMPWNVTIEGREVTLTEYDQIGRELLMTAPGGADLLKDLDRMIN